MTTCHTIICDIKYVAPALAFYRSLRAVAGHSLRIYTLDVEAAAVLRQFALERAEVFAPDEYIPPEVEKLRQGRSRSAFAFTLKPFVLLHATSTGAEWTSYFDTDIGLFADPARLLEGLPPDTPASFTPHRFSTVFRYSESSVGRFNAGYVAFRNGPQGRRILEDWRDRCVDWCQDFVDGNRYSDQKYLDELAVIYPSIDICHHKGANVAPWNISGVRLSLENQQVRVDNDPLVFYHFQGLKMFGPRLFDLYASSALTVDGPLLELVYRPYVLRLAHACDDVSRVSRRALEYSSNTWSRMLARLGWRQPGNLYRVHRSRA
jgi:hypothetical protein